MSFCCITVLQIAEMQAHCVSVERTTTEQGPGLAPLSLCQSQRSRRLKAGFTGFSGCCFNLSSWNLVDFHNPTSLQPCYTFTMTSKSAFFFVSENKAQSLHPHLINWCPDHSFLSLKIPESHSIFTMGSKYSSEPTVSPADLSAECLKEISFQFHLTKSSPKIFGNLRD